jgi:hypothetical protein
MNVCGVRLRAYFESSLKDYHDYAMEKNMVAKFDAV